MNRVKWGIISTGRITHQIVQDFKHVPNGEVVAVASRSQDSADAFAAQYEIPRAYSSYQQLLENPDVDAVYIATPHTLHYQNSIDANLTPNSRAAGKAWASITKPWPLTKTSWLAGSRTAPCPGQIPSGSRSTWSGSWRSFEGVGNLF
jgi:hypothetical protein